MAAIVQPLTEAHWKQTVKTGIAGSLAMFLANTLHLPQPYWAAVGAVIVMQSEFNATRKVGFTRIGRHLHRCCRRHSFCAGDAREYCRFCCCRHRACLLRAQARRKPEARRVNGRADHAAWPSASALACRHSAFPRSFL